MTEVINEQRRILLNTRDLSHFADLAVRSIREAQNRTPVIAFVTDAEMKRLNSEFRKKDATTDVLSFQYSDEEFEPGDSLGDIVISAEQAAKQASQHGLDLDLEIKQLILHGLLHLCGYDHETDDGEMDSR
ncbi:MAG: rRNA maturation RNase YbeY, partial [Acidobacteriota bacterium]|nr:rRNA maturation RNase YbeY [Acidobacteriota bacterium]